MNDPSRMRVRKRGSDLHRDLHGGGGIDRASIETFFQRLAFEKFHREIRSSVDVEVREQPNDARVIELPENANLTGEAHGRRGRELHEHLERDVRAVRIARDVHLAVAAFRDEALDDVVAGLVADRVLVRHARIVAASLRGCHRLPRVARKHGRPRLSSHA
jgi:hypothetical protein